MNRRKIAINSIMQQLEVGQDDATFVYELESRSMSSWTADELQRYKQITGQWDMEQAVNNSLVKQ